MSRPSRLGVCLDGPIREREQRALLRTIPGVGFVTAEVILAELADITRFRSQCEVVAYAGLVPGQRESAGKTQELHLEKTGSKLLRTTMVEAAWLVRHSPRWKGSYEKLKPAFVPKRPSWPSPAGN
jgi:transposase